MINPAHLDKLFFSTKTYTHESGLSCCFRQWRADSHCSQMHGYALQVKIVFGAKQLDERNWVVDFGGLKEVKAWLTTMFDHTTLVAEDDPFLPVLNNLNERGVINIRTVPSVGCESFAAMVLDYVRLWMSSKGLSPRCRVISVEVAEHGGNSAICYDREAHASLSA